MDDPLGKIGYCHPDYASSLSDFGIPRYLDHSKGWILQRSIPKNDNLFDAMGLYPVFSCPKWRLLPKDIDAMENCGMVSLMLVTDPFMDTKNQKIFRRFDFVRLYKTHYLTNNDQAPEKIVSGHHLYYSRKAAREITVEISQFPVPFLNDWLKIYSQLIDRYGITGLRAFSKASFSKLFKIPGVYLFRALRKNRLIGAQIVIWQNDVAFAHLAAFTQEGYKHGASYALDWNTLKYFQDKVKFVNWGGGSTNHSKDGLSNYKKGWSNETMDSYLLGVIFNPSIYDQLFRELKQKTATDYFPAYRCGEFIK